MPDFKPSQVHLGVPPLTGTMGRCEREVAAAWAIRTLHVNGDEWKPWTPRDIGLCGKAEAAADSPLFTNPFLRPDFRDLVANGFARFTDEAAGFASPIEFTDAGFEAMRRYVVQNASR